MPDRDWILIVTLGMAWGTTFALNEVLLTEIGPLAVAFARVSTAALACGLWIVLTGRGLSVPRAALPALAVMGALMFAAPFAIFPLGQQFVASGIAGIVNALTPVAVVIVSHLWPGGERATPLKAMGVAAGFAGIVFLTLPALKAGEESRLFGTLVLVLAPVSYAVAMNWVRRLHGIDTTVMVTWAFGFGALLLLPLVLVLEGASLPHSPGTWAAVAVIGPVLTGLTFATAFSVMRRAGATRTSTVTFIAPVSALLIGKLVLGEELTALHFAGMAAIFAGLFLIDGRLFGRGAAPKLN